MRLNECFESCQFFFSLLSSRISYILTSNEKHFGKTKNYVATVDDVASGSTVQDRKNDLQNGPQMIHKEKYEWLGLS